MRQHQTNITIQHIEIKNFGPIEEVSLEIKDFSVFIGTQASGKSTIAKAIFFFKSLGESLVRYIADSTEHNSFDTFVEGFGKVIKKKFVEYFGWSKPAKNLALKYIYTEHIWISIAGKKNRSEIEIHFSDGFVSELEGLLNTTRHFFAYDKQTDVVTLTSKQLLEAQEAKNRFIESVRRKCCAIFHEERELIFIPAGRSIITTLSEQLQFVNLQNIDFLTRAFVERINLVRPIFQSSLLGIVEKRKLLQQIKIDHKTVELARKLVHSVLKGEYRYGKDGEKIYYDSLRFINLKFSSSGQQESLWILLLLFVIVIERQSVFVVIEEPEAHLFPEAQREISNLIALVSSIENSQVVITTHSPYVLASFNNLILAHKVAVEHHSEVRKKVDERLWLSNDKVCAALVENGRLQDIMDDELGIIQQEKIDSASRIINDEFDYLFQFETAL